MSINDMWNTITPKSRGGSTTSNGRRERDELQDGEYTVAVTSFDYWSHDDGKPNPERYKWGLEVVDGLCKGKYVEKYQRASQIGLQILADDLMLLLGTMPSGDEVYNRASNKAGVVVSALQGKVLKMRQRTSASGYPNFYFNEVVDNEFDKSPAPDNSQDDDDIPF
jgi:hypothetical protein|tara:strand:- start:14 stop:511 length:498 start_codon:yes stop_codon:yes gene_type:complete